MKISVILTIVNILSVIGLLCFERNKVFWGKATCKTIASFAFLFLALSLGAWDKGFYGKGIAISMVFCLFGDLFLLSPKEKIFKMGIASFLIGHLFYMVAFILGQKVFSATWMLVGLAFITVLGKLIWTQLSKSISSDFKIPVIAYISVISLMVISAFSVVGAGAPKVILMAALLFYFSDIAVARNRFVKEEFVNRLIGLPLYYGAQLVFAWSLSLNL
ncbi:MAG: lysoplasmalogenase [Bacteriovoracaceae bacterium]|jgi:uncharacterized membrane protein YhhN|nr:lysoplasmalogenase [Bacteriovoracaceae bacterium]